MIKEITTTAELEKFCHHLKDEKWITVDTEFIREKTYYPELCLIQVASATQEALIDPLTEGIKLSAFWQILANKNIVKVLHAASQDLEIFYHESDQEIHNIFDTQIAAQALGYGESIGYDRLVETICNVKLDKTSRHTDWRLRPLSDKQKTYAIYDVTYLREIYTEMQNRLSELNRFEWIIEEMDKQYPPARFQRNPYDAYLRIKIRKPRRNNLVILQELAAWRDDEAFRKNIPRQYIMRDDALIDIAMLQPRDIKSLSRIRSVSEKEANSNRGKLILSLIETALNRPQETWPKVKKIPNLSEETKITIELLKTLLRVVAENNQLTPRLIADNEDIYKLATQKENAKVDCLKGWRNEIYGQKALMLMGGKIGLALNKGKIQFVPVSFIN
ncbi:MAG: ribonuclease D [Alphaproteobacteria bacterium]